MPSADSKVLDRLYKFITTNLGALDPTAIPLHRLVLEALHSTAKEPTGVTYEHVQCPGSAQNSIWCKPLSAPSTHAILYHHGGGGFAGSPASHRKLAGHIAKAVGCNVLVFGYRLAPEHPFPAGLDDSLAAYQWLLDLGYAPENIASAGDSAGGNLAVSLVLRAKQEGLPLPGVVAVFSPWLDMEQGGRTIETNAGTELLSSPEILKAASMQYLGGASPKNPLANPLYGDFEGFPPLYVNAGGAELLEDHATRLAARAQAAGVRVKLEVEPGMQHVYIFMAGTAVEADGTISSAAYWMKKHMGLGHRALL